ncbi:hypothetical protein PILCRDRAFT_90566 [Piloderma croceum F 1598]|uniref:Uncharacterized protein n=1 Tax=Piloderma croceum (strain F 1598) TaxID=765440 RepID=A0A0C3F1L7_PILCF|nr:hypothetical protein PILCRDRAFT_90566 [Piloderma croceum F 1598]
MSWLGKLAYIGADTISAFSLQKDAKDGESTYCLGKRSIRYKDIADLCFKPIVRHNRKRSANIIESLATFKSDGSPNLSSTTLSAPNNYGDLSSKSSRVKFSHKGVVVGLFSSVWHPRSTIVPSQHRRLHSVQWFNLKGVSQDV